MSHWAPRVLLARKDYQWGPFFWKLSWTDIFLIRITRTTSKNPCQSRATVAKLSGLNPTVVANCVHWGEWANSERWAIPYISELVHHHAIQSRLRLVSPTIDSLSFCMSGNEALFPIWASCVTMRLAPAPNMWSLSKSTNSTWEINAKRFIKLKLIILSEFPHLSTVYLLAYRRNNFSIGRRGLKPTCRSFSWKQWPPMSPLLLETNKHLKRFGGVAKAPMWWWPSKWLQMGFLHSPERISRKAHQCSSIGLRVTHRISWRQLQCTMK